MELSHFFANSVIKDIKILNCETILKIVKVKEYDFLTNNQS